MWNVFLVVFLFADLTIIVKSSLIELLHSQLCTNSNNCSHKKSIWEYFSDAVRKVSKARAICPAHSSYHFRTSLKFHSLTDSEQTEASLCSGLLQHWRKMIHNWIFNIAKLKNEIKMRENFLNKQISGSFSTHLTRFAVLQCWINTWEMPASIYYVSTFLCCVRRRALEMLLSIR